MSNDDNGQWPLGRPKRAEEQGKERDPELDWVPHETNSTLQRNTVTGKIRTKPYYLPPLPQRW